MPFRPEHSLLRVEVPALHSIDTSSVESLFGMWSLFSKASHAMEDGRRLENLSWRLWNRETFCCNPKAKAQAQSTSSPRLSCSGKAKEVATNIPMPELSTSLDSASSEELVDEPLSQSVPSTTIPKARPELIHADSCKSRSRSEKHITPADLQSFVTSIKDTKGTEPIDVPIPTSPKSTSTDPPPASTSDDLSSNSAPATATKQPSVSTQDSSSVTASRSTLLESSASTVDTNDDRISETVGSESSSNTEMSTHSIIRGFVPGGAPSSYRSQTNLASQPTPILKTSPQYAQSKPKKKGPMFTIGTSSGEEESSLESHMYKSSLSERLRRPDSTLSTSSSKKQTSFKDEVAVGRAAEHSPVFESDDEDEEVSESAIEDDDDSSDWEDSDEQSGPSSVNEKEMFQRVDSRPNLTSRRSLLTSLMHEPDRAKALANAASKSTPHIMRRGNSRTTTPNGPSVATSPEPNAQVTNPETTVSKPIIMTTSNTHQQQLALSPRTTRRNMLSTELTESLRKNLLWERQHRSTGNLAALKRRHTSNDVKNLRQQPEPGPVLSHQDGTKRFTNDYFHAGLQEYHAKGW